jgi:predicted metal-dependent hydrolase
MVYDPLYVEFIHYFNKERDFFECHEVLEELWLEEGRSPLYQGLLQVAVGLHHYSYHNVTGAIKLFQAGVDKLHHYRGQDIGIDLDQYIANATEYIAKLNAIEEEPFAFYCFDIKVLDAELAKSVEQLRINPPQKQDDPQGD